MKKILLLMCLLPTLAFSRQTIQFSSLDNLLLTADYYAATRASKKYILLCHQAGWSRGEYLETAPWLNELGFNVLALDQRSGNVVNGVVNQTAKLARDGELSTKYIAAKPDIEAAIKYMRENFQMDSFYLLGSSYSASLAIKIAGEYKYDLDAVMAFSPGEYFSDKSYIQQSAKNIKAPVFITAKREEHHYWGDIAKKIPGRYLTVFVPTGEGEHGSRALWVSKKDHREYRLALKQFLEKINGK
ncbi:MAG: lysophospholipase [Gammaproteobacteria bacterium]|nr:lysophospholipase [Gammaproteobacteria bacterium]